MLVISTTAGKARFNGNLKFWKWILKILVLFLLFSTINSLALESGKVIPVSAPGGLGPLASPGVVSYPLGVAQVLGTDQPEIFIRTTKYGVDPGLYMYPAAGYTTDGVPIFEPPIKVGYPFPEATYPPQGTVFKTEDGKVHALWVHGKELIHSVLKFEPDYHFESVGVLIMEGFSGGAQAVAVMPDKEGFQLVIAVSNGKPYVLWKGSKRSTEYQPFKGDGTWHGGFSHAYLLRGQCNSLKDGTIIRCTQFSNTDHEVRFHYGQLTAAKDKDGKTFIIGGSRYGNLSKYIDFSVDGKTKKQHLLKGPDGILLRHPTIDPHPVFYPNPDNDWSDLLVGGEGGIYSYRWTKDGFKQPVPALQKKAHLYGGSLPVSSVVDWNGDGLQDLIAGNSEGFVLFFKNIGSKNSPQFANGVHIKAGGEDIYIQSGYRGSIQGPGEARWGYVCPTVVDWNEDGLLDILLSDAIANHTVFINQGSRTNPQLDRGLPLYCEGLDLHGTWRTQPAIAKMGKEMAYITLDENDYFHIYSRIDDYNVHDRGVLKLEDGSVINANYLEAGGTGRLKLILYDWDQDGAKDLIVGTPRHGSIPNPETGLPYSLGYPGSSVLFLKNTGTDEMPVFAFPKIFTHKGVPIFLGQHAAGPAVAELGNHGGADLIVAHESGVFFYFSRQHLGLIDRATALKYLKEHGLGGKING